MKKIESYQELYYALIVYKELKETKRPKFLDLRDAIRTEIEAF